MFTKVLLVFTNAFSVFMSFILLVIAIKGSGKKICSIRRNFFRSTGLYSIFTINSLFLVLSAAASDKTIWYRLIIFFFTLLASVILFVRGEGATEKGVYFSLSFNSWEEIQAYGWKPHYKKNNQFLVMRITNKYTSNFSRFIVVDVKNKDKLEKCFVDRGIPFVENI